MNYLFEIKDKIDRRIHLSLKQWKHIQKHPSMHDKIESIKDTIRNPTTIRYFEEDEKVINFYKEFKHRSPLERYLLVSVKYLNGEGFIITSFFTNRITGSKWKIQ